MLSSIIVTHYMIVSLGRGCVGKGYLSCAMRQTTKEWKGYVNRGIRQRNGAGIEVLFNRGIDLLVRAGNSF